MTARRFSLLCTACALLSGLASSPLDAQESDLVYISNITGTTADGEALTTIEEQTKEALARLGDALRERCLGYGDVVVSNVFLKDARHFRAMNEIYRGYFEIDPPTRATVQVDLPDPDALIQISVGATRAAKQVITPSQMKSPELPYSWGIKVGNTLFIAGATSRSPETYQPVTGDAATQTRRVFGNIGFVLEEAGMDYGDLVSCRVFLDDARLYADMNQAYAEFVPTEDPPARAVVRAGLMNPVFDVEVQCIAEAASSRNVVVGEGMQRPRLPLAPAISTGDRLYLSGMVGRSADGVPPDIGDQTRNTLANLRATLQRANMDFTDVVDMWVYVNDIRQLETIKEVLDELLPEDIPEGTVIGTPLMRSAFLVEIQMEAAR